MSGSIAMILCGAAGAKRCDARTSAAVVGVAATVVRNGIFWIELDDLIVVRNGSVVELRAGVSTTGSDLNGGENRSREGIALARPAESKPSTPAVRDRNANDGLGRRPAFSVRSADTLDRVHHRLRGGLAQVLGLLGHRLHLRLDELGLQPDEVLDVLDLK